VKENANKLFYMLKSLPIENIKEVLWVEDKVFILYKDGSKLISNANEVRLVSDYKNDSEIPLNDHCL
jgi:hypothetical protein